MGRYEEVEARSQSSLMLPAESIPVLTTVNPGQKESWIVGKQASFCGYIRALEFKAIAWLTNAIAGGSI